MATAVRGYTLRIAEGQSRTTITTYCDGHTDTEEIPSPNPYDPCTRPEGSTGLPPDQATTLKGGIGITTPAQQTSTREFCDGHSTTEVIKTASDSECLFYSIGSP